MSKTITPFDPEFPYRLTDDEYNRIHQVSSTLSVLSALSGQVSVHDRYAAPQISVTDLHEMLCGLYESLDTVAAGLELRSKAELQARINPSNHYKEPYHENLQPESHSFRRGRFPRHSQLDRTVLLRTLRR